MVPQGQLAYFTPTAAAPAPPMYQALPFQFSQPSHVSHMPSASPASSSEPSMYGHPPHPVPFVGAPASVSPSSNYPSSIQHINSVHNAGSEHENTSTSFSDGGIFFCQWQGQDLPPSSSPPPPAYPPGFEPKENDASTMCIPSGAEMGNPVIPTSRPHSHPHVNALSQPPPFPPPYLHPPPPSHLHHHPSSQTACHSPSPMLLPTVQTASMGHGFDASGTVIGVPVLGTPIFADGTCAAPPPVIPPVQQPLKTSQPTYGQRPVSSESRQQPSKSTFHLTKYFRGNNFHVGNPLSGVRNVQQNTWQPSNRKMQRFGVERHATLRSQDFNQRQVPYMVGHTSMDCQLSTEDNHQLQVPVHELNFSTSGRQPPSTHRVNQPNSSERVHFKACSAKEITLPKAQEVYVNAEQSLVPCQSSEPKENLHCEVIRYWPDEQPLRSSSGQRSSLASACSEAQLTSHVKCEETACSPSASGDVRFFVEGELVKDRQMGNDTTLVDSKAAPLPSAKKNEGLNRWLQERKQKYPTPANILRKAEERRKQEEMGEVVIDKPKTRLQHIKGVLTKCYHRRERPRFDNTMKYQEHRSNNSQLANTDSRYEESNCEKNGLADSCRSANGSEIAQEAEPIESPALHMEVSDLAKCIQGTDLQSILASNEIVEQSNIEETPGPGHVFLFRRKRQKRNCDRSTLGAQRQKQLLFKVLGRDIEKENSYLMQCCRFIVNNHFFQGLSSLNVKHFKWVGAEKPYSANDTCMDDRMHDSPGCARQTEMPTLDAQDILTEKIATDPTPLANGGQEHASLGKGNCEDANEPSLATVENACDDNVSVKDAQYASALLPQELSCSNTEQEPIGDAQHAPALPPQEMSSSCNGQDLIEDEEYNDPGSQNRFVTGSHRTKEAPFPWKHLDGFIYQKSTVSGLAARHYDCSREPFCVNGLIIDAKHAPLLHTSSNLDAQGVAPFPWEHSNADTQLPDHEMETGDLDSGIGDHLLNDDDDILQYMNFDAFETDSGICYV